MIQEGKYLYFPGKKEMQIERNSGYLLILEKCMSSEIHRERYKDGVSVCSKQSEGVNSPLQMLAKEWN